MSREDPQLRIRLPIGLKEKIEVSAKENNRSMNAEIVQRLERTYLTELADDEVLSAQDVIKIVASAKDELSDIIFKRTFSEINKKARMGHKGFHIPLGDLELEELSKDDFYYVLKRTFDRLTELGFTVPEKSLDNVGFLIEISD
ncbi:MULTISPECIES: Arc family DNA-binding protein [Enterobacter]|jgi:plasmid stability protein|uniref:Arc family DNA-binding protein n=1 Tax=Enterobacter TaxID=547 RepID=UPI0015E52BCC|nr:MULTISPECIES: Arc family DNA-binding protein [Enterobacter]ELN9421875.1 Arc family DNA-binding protein [Enterobacter ludwigii]MDC7311859.1 Arc family DNA-binding protein [Enterobacter ludwigii]MDI0401911.1 Arc family DNA-binding protein [Enterobacter ludwigii]MDI0411454.1 Arc family DNA-binding protein [Enterobacter ludwigii]MDI0416923.1 Arc family DNA-binding protein [Enterobacter ludwigii]